MSYPLQPPIAPMLAKLTADIPVGSGWLYEPKWDGFRAIVFRGGSETFIASRNGQPLGRYFPELVELVQETLPGRSVIDGEIVIAGAQGLDFDALQLRIHPAKSRVEMLAKQIPSSFVAFDLLGIDDENLMEEAMGERRQRLEEVVSQTDRMLLTPQTLDAEKARGWFERFEGAGLDGLIAKREDLTYRPGVRAMLKIKHSRTVDCVVAGYRVAKGGDGVGSLLLGLYDGGTLHYVGHTSSFKAEERRRLAKELEPLRGDGGFGDGRTPGGISRWSGSREAEWVSLRPERVCEVTFDHMQGDRFRHASRFLRWRTDKSPRECTFDQLVPPEPLDLAEITRL